MTWREPTPPRDWFDLPEPSSKDRAMSFIVNALVILMLLAIVVGAVMGIYTNDNRWFILCGFVLLFLS